MDSSTWPARFGLTDRETTVMALVARGRDTRTVAHVLGISARTVEKHVENALRKLRVQSRVAAVARLLGVEQDVDRP